ncbi:MAG: glycoside hydrolase family 97 N-terminal domain-containing protein [Planctomycetia bacterium]|nr:glycoside hydrolase family 97 N-terminal domain-containing protein [Planctomycetia bacterium]
MRFVLSCWVLLAVSVGLAEEVSSPDGKIQVQVSVRDGVAVYACQYQSRTVLAESSLGFALSKPLAELEILRTERFQNATTWKPVWGEYAEIPDRYHGMRVWFGEKTEGGRTFAVEFRAYDEGFAFRYQLVEPALWGTMERELTEFRLTDCVVFPIAGTESTFPKEPVPLAEYTNSCAPLTGRFADGSVFSLMEAYAVRYPRLRFFKNDTGAVQVKISATSLESAPKDFTTPWRLVMLAPDAAKLVEHEYMTMNLNPPCEADASWVVPGKTLSNTGNCSIRMDDLIGLVDFAAEYGMKYVQIDWGWYGTEWSYTDAECEEWLKNNPRFADDTTWRANCKPDPYKVAQGTVPYFPRFKASTFVDMDIEKLVAYGKEKGVGICLYLNDRMIKTHDIDDLFAHYATWGLAGLKPGFVAYGSAKNTDELRYLNETAAKHRLWLCIHDAYLPDGSSRTYPGLMNVEGGGGQEGWHPDYHDVTLPFTRGLVGPFDYTPMLFCPKKSNAHQLSLMMTLYAPAPVIRGGWRTRNATQGNALGSEKEFLRDMPTTWNDTNVLDAEIGRHIVTVRKAADNRWFLGATNGSDAYTSEISLSFLDPGREYTLKLWLDAAEADGDWRGTTRVEKKVRATDTLQLPMAPGGGAVAIFE